MDELEISGKRYISTRRAAREHGYHSDYMGQLIRGKKVAGEKVGRAWYIEEDSLNAYLGKAPAPALAPKAAPAPAPAEESAAVVERLVVEDAPAQIKVQEEVQQEAEVLAAQSAQDIDIKEEEHPIVVHVEPQIKEPVAQPLVQEIHHAHIEETQRRVPIHAAAAAALPETGGLRYAADDSPSMPLVVRMPQPHVEMHAQAGAAPTSQSPARSFPYTSLSIVALVAVLAATFASNFISATVVSRQGETAVVQYAIHW